MVKIQLSNKKYSCPYCGYMSFDEPSGSYSICQICFWEDDAVQLAYPYSRGANLPLVEAQANYVAFGACDEHSKQYVREPIAGDMRDPQWRSFDPVLDSAEAGPQDGQSYFEAVSVTESTKNFITGCLFLCHSE